MAKYRTEKTIQNIAKFHSLGNLAFYPNYPPAIADPSRHFFYFNTLLTDYARGGRPEYRIRANAIGNAAIKALTNSPFDSDGVSKEDNRALQHIREALKIVEEGIRYEQNNELKYIQQRLNNLKKITSNSSVRNKDLESVEQNLKTLYTQIQKQDSDSFLDQGIDYRLLIDTINIILQGGENSKAIYEYESERLEDVNKRYLQAKKSFGQQIENYLDSHKIDGAEGYEKYEKAMKKFDRVAATTYLTHHTFDISHTKSSIQQKLKAAMKGTKTIDTVMGEKITAYLNEIFSNSEKQEELLSLINEKELEVNDFKKSKKGIKTMLIVLITKFVERNVSEILKNNLDVQHIVEDFEKEIEKTGKQEYHIQIEGLYKNFAQYGHQLDFFKKSIDDILKKDQSATGLYDALVDFKERIDKEIKNKKNTNLSEDAKQVRSMLGLQKKGNKYEEIMKFIDKLKEFQDQIKTAEDPRKISDLVLPALEKGESITLSIKEQDGKIEIEGLDKLGQTNIAATLNIKQTYSPKNLKDAISFFKRQASKSLRDSLTEIIQNASSEKNMKEQVMQQLSLQLQNIQVEVSGPDRSAITSSIQQALTDDTIWTSKLNVKNSGVSISVNTPSLFNFKLDTQVGKINQQISTKISDLMERSSQEYGEAYRKYIHNNLKKINKDRAFTDYRRLTEDFIKANKALNTKYVKISKEFKETEKELRALIESESGNKEEIEKIIEQQKTFLQELRDTIYISNTTKTFDTYQNNIGFVGDSIGADAATQISNLNIIFQQAGAGLTQEEINWLIFAVINNSSFSVVGYKNENLIESILGSLAIFAMFDEGGAELQLLKNRIDKATQDMIDPNIMHLYLLNGIYYPGSFILATIRQTLLQMLDTIDKVNENKMALHSNIRITNEVSINDLPNRNVIESESTLDTHPWETVANIANNKTQVHVVFLAGLLDVIKELKKAENGIYLP